MKLSQPDAEFQWYAVFQYDYFIIGLIRNTYPRMKFNLQRIHVLKF